jgi:hypothetical protein
MKLTRSLAAAGLLTLTVLAVGNDWAPWVRAVLGLAWFVLVVAVFDWLARQDRELADRAREVPPHAAWLVALGAVLGFLAGLTGIGGSPRRIGSGRGSWLVAKRYDCFSYRAGLLLCFRGCSDNPIPGGVINIENRTPSWIVCEWGA